ncbi:MAG: PVC-type heme-binding CxxCH protein [Planctomyces sp.]
MNIVFRPFQADFARRFQTAMCLAVCLILSLCIQGSLCIAEEFQFGDRTLKVADGYTVEKVTDPSLVERPIAVARDERGRLYVTDSGGMTERAEQQLEAKPHRIRRLDDTDGDGQYDRSTLFADRMMFPEGCLWRDGSLYVAAPPEIWKLTDSDDDGVAEKREVWYDGKTLTGCGNDLHGPYEGPDGRLYWCKGAFAEQTHQLGSGRTLITGSSHIFRSRPDGSDRESVMVGGMDNPVNVAFFPTGDRFLSCTFFQFPEAGRRDGMIHTIYGGVYGKKHGSIYSHIMTGNVMPVLNHQGAAAPCGMIAGSEALFGGGADRSIFTCYFNLHKVMRHDLSVKGATYTTADTDLLSCDHPDFHPTDVFEDADGSLLIVDTGGWYKVCCPTSQLAKPDVLGAIYRVRRRGAPSVTDPLGLQIAWDAASPSQLAKLLADPRLFVHRRATMTLRNQGQASVASLRDELPTAAPTHRMRILWTLAGIESESARAASRQLLNDQDPQIRLAAVSSAGLWRDREALPELLQILKAATATGSATATDQNTSAAIVRASAESVGRIQAIEAVDLLLEAAGTLPSVPSDSSGAPSDDDIRIQEHSLIFALIEIGDAEKTKFGLKSASAGTRRAALVALDQMSGNPLTPDQVIPLMKESDPILRSTAVWIVKRHSDWGKPLADHFRSVLASAETMNDELRAQTAELLSSLISAEDIQKLITEKLSKDAGVAERLLTLNTVRQASLTATPTAWLDALAGLLPEAPSDEIPLIVSAVANLPLPKEGHAGLRDALLTVASRKNSEVAVRLDAILAAGPGLSLNASHFELLMESMSPDQQMEQRSAASRVLGTASLSKEQRQQLLTKVRHVGPMELPKILPALEQDPSEPYGLQLVSALETSDGVRGLRADLIKPLLARYPASVQAAGKPLMTLLNASAEQQAAHLDQILKSRPPGDVRRGHEVFMSRKAGCYGCHKLGYGGGRLGPDLSAIGKTRNHRDLIEAVVYPSASIVRGYEPVVVELIDGRTVAGIVISENRSEVTIGIDAEKQVHLSREEIEQISPSPTSVMPNGIATLLTPQELSDLLEFLAERK